VVEMFRVPHLDQYVERPDFHILNGEGALFQPEFFLFFSDLPPFAAVLALAPREYKK